MQHDFTNDEIWLIHKRAHLKISVLFQLDKDAYQEIQHIIPHKIEKANLEHNQPINKVKGLITST